MIPLFELLFGALTLIKYVLISKKHICAPYVGILQVFCFIIIGISCGLYVLVGFNVILLFIDFWWYKQWHKKEK